jgi:L-threonylcarbamoyladenylate synthase
VIVPIDEAFNMTLATLRRGGVVALPTDTVYGIAALARDPSAMARVFELKGRDEVKSIAVLVSDLDQARSLTSADLDRYAPHWPGPLTVVARRRDDVELHLGADPSTVGIRCPDSAFVRRLAQELGPIAATSANLSGQPTLTTAGDVAAAFPDLTVVVDGGPLLGSASTVVDATVDPPVVLRAGPISPNW